MGCRTFVFDGDNVRHGLCSDLVFSVEDRSENIRRIGERANIFRQAGVIALTAFSPLEKNRRKGLYKKGKAWPYQELHRHFLAIRNPRKPGSPSGKRLRIP